MVNATITKIAQLSDKLSKSKLNELEQQTQTKFIFKGVCGEIDFYANCSDVFKIKYKQSGTQYLIKGLEVSENEFFKTYDHIWCILKNNNNIEFSQITEWDSQRDLEAPYNMIPCAIKTFVIAVYTFKDGKAIYHDIEMNKHEATINSSFYHYIDSVQATGKYGAIVSTTPVSYIYKIDGNCVDRETFNGVINLFKGANSTTDFDVSFGNPHIDKPIKIVFELNTEPILRLHNGDSILVNCDIASIAERVYKKLYEPPAWKANNPALKNIKENEDMPKIVNYKYNPETKTTTLYWSDNSQTSVTADPDTEANEFTGFCAACAKKLFGNKSTYLNQFDKWAVKKPEQERKKAEAEKAKAEEQAKINAEKAERAKARKIKRLAKKWANEYRMMDENTKIYKEAEKLAKEKYGVPNEYFEDDCDCGCECGCKELDVMDEDDNNISD